MAAKFGAGINIRPEQVTLVFDSLYFANIVLSRHSIAINIYYNRINRLTT